MNDWILRLLSHPSINKPMEGKAKWVTIGVLLLLFAGALVGWIAIKAALGIPGAAYR